MISTRPAANASSCPVWQKQQEGIKVEKYIRIKTESTEKTVVFFSLFAR